MNPIKILILEDSLDDFVIIVSILKKELNKPFEYKHAINEEEFVGFLETFSPDVILSDYQIPSFNGLEALKISKKRDPGLPFIIVTGSINEETAVDCIKAGAWDYVIKDNIIRLVPAINGALEKQEWINSQKKTSEALKRNERELAAIFDNSPTIMMVVNGKREILKINKTGLKTSGLPLNEILGSTTGKALKCKNYYDIKTKKINKECEKCNFKKFIDKCIIESQPKCNTEITIETLVNKTTEHKTYLCYFEKLWSKPEETALLTLLDITTRKETEKKLIESEQRFREMADTLPEIIFEINQEGYFTFLNKTAFNKYNLDPEKTDITNLKITEFIHHDDLENITDNISKIIQGEKFSGYEYKSILPGDKTGYFQILNSPVIKGGKILGIRGIAIDITQRKSMEDELNMHRERLEAMVNERTAEFEQKALQLKESQLALSYLLDDVNESREELLESNREIRKLSQALEQSPSSVFITDIDGNIEYVNRKFIELSGYSRNEVIGKNPNILNSGIHDNDFFTNLWKIINAGENWYGEICNKKKNGELYWEYTSISPLRNDDNDVTNFIAIKEDITERKEIENKLKEYTEELELFNKAMVDRELKIIEMKEEVNMLCQELGKEIKYPPVWDEKKDNS